MGKGEETRNAILERALAMASRHGLEALTIGLLAKETGLSKSGLFAHFESKENLQIGVLETALERFREILAPAFRAPRGEPRLRAIFERMLTWEKASFLPGGCVFVNVARELDQRPGPVREVLIGSQRELISVVKRVVRMAIEEGHFRADLDLGQFAYEFYANFLSYHHFRYLLQDPAAEEKAVAALEHLIENARLRA